MNRPAATAELRRIATRTWDRYGLSPESRQVAFDSCFSVAKDGTRYISRRATTIYRILAATEGPYEPRR